VVVKGCRQKFLVKKCAVNQKRLRNTNLKSRPCRTSRKDSKVRKTENVNQDLSHLSHTRFDDTSVEQMVQRVRTILQEHLKEIKNLE
jgi:hypothetical protein